MRRLLTLASLVVPLASCFVPTDACGCPPVLPLFALHVAGTVIAADATPLSGLVVSARAFRAACLPTDSGGMHMTASSVPSDAAGRFAFELQTGMAVASGRVRISARHLHAGRRAADHGCEH